MILSCIIGIISLVLGVQGQKKISWVGKMPSNFLLSKGDQVKIPISEFVSIKGAQFKTNMSQSMITPNLRKQREVNLEEPTTDNCQIMRPKEPYLFAHCKDTYFSRIKMNHNFGIKESVSTLELSNSLFNYALHQCQDMFFQENEVFLLCRNSKKPAEAVLYAINYQTTPMTFKYTELNLQRDMKYIKMKVTSFKPSNEATILIFYEGLPSDSQAGDVLFTSCSLMKNFPNKITTPCELVNIATVIGESTLHATIRTIGSITGDEVLAVLAIQTATEFLIRLEVMTLSGTGKYQKSLYAGKNWYPGMMRGKFFPKEFAGSIEANPSYVVIYLLDLNYLMSFNLTYDKTNATSYLLNVGQVSVHTLDCGLSTVPDTFVSRIISVVKNAQNPSDNVYYIEYRSTLNDHAIKEFAANFKGSQYACSYSSGFTGKLQTVVFFGGKKVTSLSDRVMTYFAMDLESYLEFDTKPMTKGVYTAQISAELRGYPAVTKDFSFSLIENTHDFAKIELQTKKLRTYKDSNFALPFISSFFMANNPKFTVTPENVRFLHAKSFTPTLELKLVDGYLIDKIYSVDHDTFVATLTKPGNFEKKLSMFFATFENDKMTLKENQNQIVLRNGLLVFKIFKLGPDHLCIIYKGISSVAVKLAISCYEDKVDGAQKINHHTITNLYEIFDIQLLETTERVDFLMIGITVQNSNFLHKLLHMYMTVDDDGKIFIAENLNQVDFSHQLLQAHQPLDVIFDFIADSEGANHVTVKMVAEDEPPVIAKFNMTFTGNVVNLKFLRLMKLSIKDLAYCVNRNEAILYNPKNRKIWAQKWERHTGVPVYDKYYFPVEELGIVYIEQFICIPEKAMFQILGQDSDSKKYIITYRGGESSNAARRVHSVVEVSPKTNFIEHGLNRDYIMTVAGAPGDNTVNRTFVVCYQEGPIFYVDNTGKDTNYKITIKAETKTLSASETLDIEIVNATYQAEAKVIKPFAMTSGAIVYLDEVAEVKGPVMDVKLSGAGNTSVAVTKRINKNKGFSTGELEQPNKIVAEKDFIGALYLGKSLKIYGDPTISIEGATEPVLVDTVIGSIRDFAMVTYGVNDRVALLYKEFTNGQYDYNLILLKKSKEVGKKPTYSREVYSRVFTTKEDFDDVKIVSIDGGDIVAAMPSKRELITNYLKLVTFRRETGKYVKAAEANLISRIDKLINSYSMVYIGRRRVAVIACSYGHIGIQTTIWDTNTESASLIESSKDIKISETESRKVFANYIRCFPKEEFKVECMIDSEGINDYLVEISFDPSYEETGEHIRSIEKIADFEMPPFFDIKKVIKGKEVFAFYLEKNSASKNFAPKRVLQQSVIDKFSDCENLIITYKPMKSSFIFTGITCSEWGKAKKIDITLEEIGGRDFVFYTKGDAPPSPKRILQVPENNERVSSAYISGIVLSIKDTNFDPSGLTLQLVGLNGEAAAQSNGITFSSLRKPAEKPSEESSGKFWTWLLIILGVIVLIVLIVFGYTFYKKKINEKNAGNYRVTEEDTHRKSGAIIDDPDDIRL